MKINRLLYLLFVLSAFLVSCSNGDDKVNGEVVEQKISITAELLQPESRMEFEDGEGTTGGVKSTWQAGDILRLYTTGNTYVATLTLEDGVGTDLGTFVSDGFVKLTSDTQYKAIALSAKKLAAIGTSTSYPNSTLPTFTTQSGNTGMQHIADETILKSVTPITYTYTNPIPNNSDGSVAMGRFEFTVQDYAVMAVKFALPSTETPTVVSITADRDKSTVKNYTLALTDIDNSKPVTAYLIVPNGTSFPEDSEIDVFTEGSDIPNYQYLTTTGVTAANGNRYLKEIEFSEFTDDPEYYLATLQANINALGGTTATAGSNVNKSIIYLADSPIKILDAGNPAIALFTPAIREAFNARTENIKVIFPNIVTFPDGTNSAGTVAGAGCFRDVATISQIHAPLCATIGNYAFNNCAELTYADFPTATSIRNNVFQSSGKLSDTNFPKVQTVYQYAFDKCLSLEQLEMPEGKTMKGYALYGINNLTMLYLPKVTNFGEGYTEPVFGVASGSKTANLTMVLGTDLAKGTSTYVMYNAFRYRFPDSFNYDSNSQAGTIDLLLGQPYASPTFYNQYHPTRPNPFYSYYYTYNKGTNVGITESGAYKVTIGNTYSSEAASPSSVGFYWWTRQSALRFGYHIYSETSSSPSNCSDSQLQQNPNASCYYKYTQSYSVSNCAYGKFNSIIIVASDTEDFNGQGGTEGGNGGIFTPGGGF